MAGDWIKMREDLYEDPAILTMAKALETRPEHIVGYCHRFWCWASRNCVADVSRMSGDTCPDSVPISVPLVSLESVLSLPGFLEMMVQVGWLKYDETPSGPMLTVPKFERHLSESAKRRALEAEKKRMQRARNMSPMSRDKRPAKSGTREEKRREEKSMSLPTEETKPPTPFELPDNLNSQKFRDAFAAWLAYKAERNERYKPLGLKGLITHMSNVAAIHGAEAVILAIERAIANTWKGWDQNSSFGATNGQRQTTTRTGSGQRYRPS